MEPQCPGHLIHDTLFFSIESLRNIQSYHLVSFKLPKNVQRGPFQGLLVFHHFFPKISDFTKQALTPLVFGPTIKCYTISESSCHTRRRAILVIDQVASTNEE